MNDIIAQALREAKQLPRRHPAEVTGDRLGDAVTKWHDRFTAEERDMIAVIRFRLEQIAEGGRE